MYRPSLAIAASALLLAALTGCADDDSAPDLAAAPKGGSPACADVVDRAPQKVLDLERSTPQAVGVAAWGTPPIVLQCGIDVDDRPTSDPCVSVDGVDWILDNPDAEDQPATLVTYGRDPAVRVTVPGDRQQALGALAELAPAVSPLPASKKCQ
jgi:uncharacterized protein DUF3515